MSPKYRTITVIVAILLLSFSLGSAAEAAPGDFGAIAYSPSKKVATFGAGGSQDSAESAAVDACSAQGGSQDCLAYLWFENGYGALARDGDNFGTGWGTNADNANAYAKKICAQHGGRSCEVVYTAHTSDTAAESPSARGGEVAHSPAQPGRKHHNSPGDGTGASIALCGLSVIPDPTLQLVVNGIGVVRFAARHGTVIIAKIVERDPTVAQEIPYVALQAVKHGSCYGLAFQAWLDAQRPAAGALRDLPRENTAEGRR
jgi:hypothetical protein